MKSMLHHLLSDAAESNPGKPALSFREHTFSYEQTWLAACAAAAQLQSVGVKRGDRIAIFIEKRIETASALFAVSMSGGLFIVVNPLLKPAQVQYILNDSGAKVLITSDYRLQQLRSTLPNTAVKHVIVVGQPPAEQLTVPVSSWQSAQILAGTPIIPNMVDIDPVGILYTSGSTGSPKGVVVSHRNLLAGAESVATYLRNSNEDVILSILPISFDAGLSQITTAFQAHAHCVLMNYVLAQDVPNLCLKHGVTGLTCVPPPLESVGGGVLARNGGEEHSLLRQYRWTHAAQHPGSAEATLPKGCFLPHVWTHRGISVDVPGSSGSGSQTRFHRQSDPQCGGARPSPGRY